MSVQVSLAEEIESLIHNNATDFEISTCFKKAILSYQESLLELFDNTQGKDFLVRHTRALDGFISHIYKTTLRLMFGNYLPMRNSIPIALFALGSYGREQLCVHSDIDLLIAYEPSDGYNCEAIIEKFLYIAWDAGLKLGHRVHKVDDLFDSAISDITIRTAIIESRFVVGSNFMRYSVEQEIVRICSYEKRNYILSKLEEAKRRHAKYPIGMQPNIKEGVGGLRDSQLLFWIAKTLYGVDSLKDLRGVLFDDDTYRRYRIALELIYRVRGALHLIAQRQHDQLCLEYIPQVRHLLGFSSDMKFATKIMEALWQINAFYRIFAAKMSRGLLVDLKRVAELRRVRTKGGFFLLNEQVFTSFKKRSEPIDSLLKSLLELDDKKLEFCECVVNRFTDVQLDSRSAKIVVMQLKSIFYREFSFEILKLFYDANILDKLFGVMSKTLFLPQFDGYHTYPVGLHTLHCMRALEQIDDPFVKELYDGLDRSDRAVLKMALFVHDAGKGRKKEHSEVGAKLVASLMKRMHFSKDDIATASTLIKHHVLLSNTAMRHNIYNEKTLYKLMSLVGGVENLKLLYILTYADMCGVGDGVYNAHSAKLLNELYRLSLEISSQNERITDASRRLKIESRIKKLDSFKNLSNLMKKRVLTVESNLLFFQHKPEEIVEISISAKSLQKYSYKIDQNPNICIEILRKVNLNLSYLLAKLSHLDVVSMEVFTLFDGVKYFKIEFSESVDDDTLHSVEKIIEDSFDKNKSIEIPIPTIKADEVSVDCNYSKTFAQLSVHTTNQRGLLAYIVSKLDKLNMVIATAKIHSTKYRARDYFLIEKDQDMCNNTHRLFEALLIQNHKV